MEPWIPQRPPQPRGRPLAMSQGPDRGLRRDGYFQPAPHSWHNGERFPQWQDFRGNPQPQQDPRGDHQQPQHVARPGEWQQSVSRLDYYEGGYPTQLYARPGTKDPYQSYYSPARREEYAYGGHYYRGHPQQQPEERAPRQASPYVWHEDYRDQKHLSEHHRENQSSPFGARSETQFQLQSGDPYKDSPASSSGQERPGDLFPESLLTGTQMKKLSLTSESNLLQQHESGLSSSGYELSQYMADAAELYDPMTSAAWRPVPAGEDVSAAGPKAPMKFYIPHVPVSFGPGGQLVFVCPGFPGDGQTALVELHSMEVILNDSEEQEEMRTFSGPLIREDVHKVDVMTFCQQRAAQSRKSETPRSRDSALLWQLLVLLCRQNGSMVGSDIAELLVQDCQKLERYKRQPPVGNLINLTDDHQPALSSGTPNLLTGEEPPSVETPAQVVEKFTKLLYYGRKKEALEWAMKNHLWGHALFLSSKMDPRTYSWVMSGFTSTLALNDPLQTLFQLMSGRIPQAATCCGDKQWEDWRPHLAVILSNQGGDPDLHERTIVTMGDTLAGKGLVEAAHFCYLVAHMPFGYYTMKTDHLALLGSSHSQEFLKFATAEAIQRTEVFEYCQRLGRPQYFILPFQVYKLLYASRLADYGLVSQALHYCEAIGTALLSQGEGTHPVLLVELIKLSDRLKLSDPLLLERRRGNSDQEPGWLLRLRKELEQKVSGDVRDARSVHTVISGAQGTTESTFSGHQGDLEATADPSAMWPTVEAMGLAQPGPQPAFPLQPGSFPAEGDLGQTGVPVPLYSVPETHLPGIGGGVALAAAPGGQAWGETQQIPPPPGDNTVSQETFQPPDGENMVSQPQGPLTPRARKASESSALSAKEDDEESSDELEKTSPPNPARKEKGSGFGWFSWFRSKPTEDTSPSGDDDDSDGPNSEETPRLPSPPQAGSGLSLTPLPEPLSLPGTSAFSRGTGEGDAQGPASGGGSAEVTGNGDLSRPQGVSSESYFSPGGLLPPPPPTAFVPLYNPAQVPQLPTATSLSRPNRLAQRRYPTQP